MSFKRIHAAYRFISGFGSPASLGRSIKAERKGINKALEILDFVTPKNCDIGRDDSHGRLIRSCLQGLLETGQRKCPKLVKGGEHEKLRSPAEETSRWSSKILAEEGAATLASAVSSCGANGALEEGSQLHGLSLKNGFYGRVPIGTSLISLYAKCGKLDDAHRVFNEMPVKNTVSWTAVISGYAQHRRLETCVYLFNLMGHVSSKPNDFTYASLLSVCTNCASLALGRSFHGQEMKIGYGSYTHVSNALISMYAKCGIIEEACYIFEKLPFKDLISWNSMIFGYAHYGNADQALDLLKEMEKCNILPDAITFLGVLSSCRHAGLLDKGHHCFRLMVKQGIKPELDHYSCIVDLLGRAGLLEEAVDFVEKMPMSPNAVIWGSLLSSCRVHGNVWIGIYAAERRLLLEPGCATTHVQLANLYASVGHWNNVANVRKLMKERGLKTTPGCSWIEIGDKVYGFKAEDGTNSELREMLVMLDTLGDHMESLRYMLRTPLDDVDQIDECQ
ncbi:uncharacterized protein A4U43_C02F2160 [Asparagus officinalis]|uniref:Pentatricopeptide repeat-containing protein n=1 Tax=Asparagus officinalis TaxID=4686 RepID=A0A5P1FF72_ASPOF|nr:pentatricopeptide repeat-containing protein At2g37320 [Asparagus officinalis]XP_020252633.1 pentatricopeptide repeat-containing protein At2g37320 [Asparagus officinalis]XP_020252634.1 pentatricopeptide repeat-containing protein At2g37320 [Asparagus officinalis]ONK77008.1 uncharacterized protein A4U43_C02F2160 [Asparagus officinalis]